MAATLRHSAGSTTRLTLLLLAVFLPPAGALVWLGLSLLAQDRDLLRQREADRREAAAETVARALVQTLSEVERALSVAAPVPDGTVRIGLRGGSVSVEPPGGLAWMPATAPLPEYAGQPFEEAERAEFADRADRGRAVYQRLSASRDPLVRAGALVRSARLARRQGRSDDALAAYGELAKVSGAAVNGMPADLVARRMICDVLRSAGRDAALAREAAALRADFSRGRWRLDRTSWEVATADIEKLTGAPVASPEQRALSAAVDIFQAAPGSLAQGRAVVDAGGVPVTLLWRRESGGTGLLVVPPSSVGKWVEQLRRRDPLTTVGLTVLTDRGEYLAGTAAGAGEIGGSPVMRLAADTGLPWTLRVAVPAAGDVLRQLAERRRLLGGGLAALMLLLAGGGYLIWRVVRRELAVARLQTEFVATVSHEFRTPLTSLRHVTELLQESDDMPADRRQSFYQTLAQSADRLHRLVESVLDFARMEAGRQPWQLRAINAGELVNAAAADFRALYPGRSLHLEGDTSESFVVMADRDGMVQALANLLENAVKYSPAGGPIALKLERSAGGVAFVVSDRGLGIPAGERREILRRFVRGRRATELGIKGTGLGLALVTNIVDAHGGTIEIASEESRGSTFIIVLPPRPQETASAVSGSTVHATDSHR